MLDTLLLALAVIFSAGALLNSWITRGRIEHLQSRLGDRLDRRVDQLRSMQYTTMRKQGWSHEELSEAFPHIAPLNDEHGASEA